MTIFNRRNALVGFITLKALERSRKKRQRSTLKLVAFVALGIVSAGILAAVLAVALRRNGKTEAEGQGLDVAELSLEAELEAELDAGIPDSAMPEPGFAE